MEPSPTLAIAANAAELRIIPATGGAIAGFTWQGHPVLRETARAVLSDVRSCACYPLVPYSNRIRDATLRFAGREHRLTRNFGSHPHAIHGVGWQRAWQVDAHAHDTIRLSFAHDAADATARGAWPWPFTATQTLRLTARADGAATLHATLTIGGRADEAFPFGLGWHPFCPRAADTTVLFEAAAVWRNDATQLPVARDALPDAWSFVRARRLADVALDNVFVGWVGTARIVQPSQGLRVTLAADRAAGNLVVYVPKADFMAVEPVTHETDAFNRAAAGTADTGMRVLAPGQAFSCTMRLTIEAFA
jgi:aldose 1-epimerase